MSGWSWANYRICPWCGHAIGRSWNPKRKRSELALHGEVSRPRSRATGRKRLRIQPCFGAGAAWDPLPPVTLKARQRWRKIFGGRAFVRSRAPSSPEVRTEDEESRRAVRRESKA